MHLKSHVIVGENYLRLNDLFENIPEETLEKFDNVPILDAPDLGKIKNLETPALRKLATDFNLPWMPGPGQNKIRIERDADILDPSSIESVLKDDIVAQNLLENPDMLQVSLDMGRKDILTQKGGPSAFEISQLSLNQDKSRFKATLLLEDQSGGTQRVALRGKIHTLVEIPVLKQGLKRGDIIQASQIEMKSVMSEKLPKDVVFQLDDLINQEVTTHLLPQQPIRLSVLQSPNIVKKGENVLVQYKAEPLFITLKCKALENGKVGQTVKFLNESTKSTIEAYVTGPGKAEIQGATPF